MKKRLDLQSAIIDAYKSCQENNGEQTSSVETLVRIKIVRDR